MQEGFAHTGDNPLRYADRKTGAAVPVYRFTDPVSSKSVCFVVSSGRVFLVLFDPKVLADPSFNGAFGLSFGSLPVDSRDLSAAELNAVKAKSVLISGGP